VTQATPKIEVEELRLSYDSQEVIHGITFDVEPNEILAVIGPAQSGKTSLLRCLNRTIDFIATAAVRGTIKVDGEDVRRVKDVFALRRRIGASTTTWPSPHAAPGSLGRRISTPSSSAASDRPLSGTR